MKNLHWIAPLIASTALLAACDSMPALTPVNTGTAAGTDTPHTPGTGHVSAPVVDASLRSDGGGVTAVAPQAATTSHTTPAAMPPAPPPSAAASAAALHGLYLQAGTFASQTSAEAAAARVRTAVADLSGKVSVAPRGAHFRVLIGPFANDAQRQSAATSIRTRTAGDVANAAP